MKQREMVRLREALRLSENDGGGEVEDGGCRDKDKEETRRWRKDTSSAETQKPSH